MGTERASLSPVLCRFSVRNSTLWDAINEVMAAARQVIDNHAALGAGCDMGRCNSSAPLLMNRG